MEGTLIRVTYDFSAAAATKEWVPPSQQTGQHLNKEAGDLPFQIRQVKPQPSAGLLCVGALISTRVMGKASRSTNYLPGASCWQPSPIKGLVWQNCAWRFKVNNWKIGSRAKWAVLYICTAYTLCCSVHAGGCEMDAGVPSGVSNLLNSCGHNSVFWHWLWLLYGKLSWLSPPQWVPWPEPSPWLQAQPNQKNVFCSRTQVTDSSNPLCVKGSG